MRRYIRRFGVALLVAGFFVGVSRADSKQKPAADEVIVADRIATAFYEKAPRSVRRAMERALNEGCAAARKDPPKDSKGRRIPFEMICDARPPLRFLREVLVTGARLREGRICSAELVGDYQYYPAEMLGDTACLMVDEDYATKTLRVHFEWVNLDD
jgi:hypothetical protein